MFDSRCVRYGFMSSLRQLALLVVCLILVAHLEALPHCDSLTVEPYDSLDATAETEGPAYPDRDTQVARTPTIEAAIIQPYRFADVGTEVGGIVSAVNFDVGQSVRKGEVVAVISPRRYALEASRAEARARSLSVSADRAEEDLKIEEELLAMDASTKQQVMRAKAHAQAAELQRDEAKEQLKIAQYNLEQCRIRAPYDGYIVERYKQPHEPVNRLEKLFGIVDTSEVYAVGNVPETLLGRFAMGAAVVFEHGSGKKYRGRVAKIGRVIDTKSATKKVYVLIKNPDGDLEMGTSGTLRPVD